MPQEPPKLLDLNQWIVNGESSRSPKKLPTVWEIDVPAKSSLSWSITLAYLTPVFSSPAEFQDRLQNLLGGDEEIKLLKQKKNIYRDIKCENITKCIKGFNPFKNRHNFYFNNYVIDVMRLFSLRLNQYAKKIKLKNETWDDELKLKAAAQLLKCCINVYAEDAEGQRNVVSYANSNNRDYQTRKIIIFQRKGIQRKENSFRFSISLENAFELRYSALRSILQKAKISSQVVAEIERDLKELKFDENFLTFILNSSHIYIVPMIYKSPYIPLKLAEAGFQTDPRVVDRKNVSGLFYAMCCADSYILNILYEYAINRCHLSEAGVRKPDLYIEDNISQIKDIMDKDRIESINLNLTNKCKHLASKAYFEFSHFNDYQLKIVKDINNQKHLMGNFDTSPLVKTEQIKNIIVAVLRNYDYYFFCGSANIPDISDSFYDYIKFSEYYENMDYFTCLLFYDQMFLLSQGLSNIVSDSYSGLEKTLFLTVLSLKLFPKLKHSLCTNCIKEEDDCERDKNVLRFIPFFYRLEFRNDVKNFLKYLESGKIDEKKLKKYDDSIIRKSFLKASVIKDEFLISRLKTYLKVATEVSLDGHSSKAVLAIERGLQVLGESLHESSTDGCVVNYLLCSCLPPELEHNLLIIRNNIFSHYRANAVQGRFFLEQKEWTLLKLIQDELKMINKKISLVYSSQNLRVKEFLIKEALHASQNSLKDHELAEKMTKEFENTAEMREQAILAEDCKYIIDYFKSFIKNGIETKLQVIKGEQKLKVIKGKFYALRFLLRLIFQRDSSERKKTLLDSLDTFIEFLKKNEEASITAEIMNKINEFLIIIQRNLSLNFKDTEEKSYKDPEYPNLNQLFKSIKDYKYFNDNEINTIRESFSTCLSKAREAKQKLEKNLRGSDPSLSPNERKKCFEQLISSPKVINELEINFESNPKAALKVLNRVRISDDVTEVLGNVEETENNLITISNDFRNSLYKMDFHVQFQEKILNLVNQKMEFLLDRIRLLKEILIDEDEEIEALWTWGRSEAIKKHTRFLMAQRYLKEGDMRASMEMLLLDCLNTVGKDKSPLFRKLNKLFEGIKMRDFLSHGSAILESICELLDSEDVPSEIVRISLELIEDADSLRAMSELFHKLKPLTTEDMIVIINDTKTDEFTNMRQQIKKCKEWKTYLQILPK